MSAENGAASFSQRFDKSKDDFIDKNFASLPPDQREKMKNLTEGNIRFVQTLALMDAVGVYQSTTHAVSHIVSMTMMLIQKDLAECNSMEDVAKVMKKLRSVSGFPEKPEEKVQEQPTEQS